MKSYINNIFDISIRGKVKPNPVKNKNTPIPNEKLILLSTLSTRQQNDGINLINKKPLDNENMQIEEDEKFDPYDYPNDKPPQKYSSNNEEILKLKNAHRDEVMNLQDMNNTIREEFNEKYDDLLREYNQIKTNLDRQTHNYDRLLNTNKNLESDNNKILQEYENVTNINNELKTNLEQYKIQLNTLDIRSNSEKNEKTKLLSEIDSLNKLLVMKEQEFNNNVKTNYEQQITSLKNELNIINEKNNKLHEMNTKQIENFNKTKTNLMNKINNFKNTSLSLKKMHIDLKSSVKTDLNKLMNLTFDDINKLSLNSKKILNDNNNNYAKSITNLKQNYESTLQQLKNEYNSSLQDLSNKNNLKDKSIIDIKVNYDKIIKDKDSLLQNLRDEYNQTIEDLKQNSLNDISQKDNSYKLLEQKLKSLERDLINKDNRHKNIELSIKELVNESEKAQKAKDDYINALINEFDQKISERDKLLNEVRNKSHTDKFSNENAIRLLNDKISELEKRYQDTLTEKQNLFNDYSKTISDNLNNYNKEIENRDNIIKDLQDKFNQMKNQHFFDIEQIQKGNNYLKNELLSKGEIITNLDGKINELNNIINTQMYSKEQLDKIENEKQLIIQSLKNEYENHLNDLQQMIVNKNTTIEDLVSKIKQLENDISSIQLLLNSRNYEYNKLANVIKSIKGLEQYIISKLNQNITPLDIQDYGDIDKIQIERSPIRETSRLPNYSGLDEKIEEEKTVPPTTKNPTTPPKINIQRTPKSNIKINLHNYVSSKTPSPLTEAEILDEEIKDYGKYGKIHRNFLDMLISNNLISMDEIKNIYKDFNILNDKYFTSDQFLKDDNKDLIKLIKDRIDIYIKSSPNKEKIFEKSKRVKISRKTTKK